MNIEKATSILAGSAWNSTQFTPFQDALDRISFKPRCRGRWYEGGGQHLWLKVCFTYRLLDPETLRIHFYRIEDRTLGRDYVPGPDSLIREIRFQLMAGPHEQTDRQHVWRFAWRLSLDDDFVPDKCDGNQPCEYYGWELPPR